MLEENIKTFVIDASFILSYLLPDEDQDNTTKEYINAYSLEKIQLIAPPLLPFEVMNGISMAYRRKRIKKQAIRKLASLFFNYHIKIISIDFQKTLSLSQKHSLTVYDASYLFLAKQQKVQLLTTDKKL